MLSSLRIRNLFAVSVFSAACLLVVGEAVSADYGLTAARWHSCKDVVVQFEPQGSGGATEIRAKRIKCKKARKTIRKCIKGELKPGWTADRVDLEFRLKKGDKRIRYLPVSAGGCIDVSRAGGPAPPDGADRIESFSPNLDKAGPKERVFVYNLPNDGFNTTYFEVWNRKHGDWKRGQMKLVAGVPGPSPYYGLEQAWVSDLNRDGRVEIAVRHSVTSSIGEVLLVYRQKSKHSARFGKLQSFGGDEVKVKPKGKGPAVIRAFLKSNHSPDNLEHHEIWKWSDMADQWTCRKDCAT